MSDLFSLLDSLACLNNNYVAKEVFGKVVVAAVVEDRVYFSHEQSKEVEHCVISVANNKQKKQNQINFIPVVEKGKRWVETFSHDANPDVHMVVCETNSQ